MNFPGSSSGAGSNPNPSRKKEIQLQGPRPPQLRVSQESRKIRKPPPHPQARPPLPPTSVQYPQPLIIYDVSPKVHHVAENNFMSVVQRLTGLSSTFSTGETSNSNGGNLSPAARFASIEKASPRLEREREIDVSDMMDMAEMAVDLGQTPGILSPAPATLAPIPAGFFSPASDPQMLSFVHDLSPCWHLNNFSASPSALLSAPLVSPISSPSYFFNVNLFDL